MKSYASNLAMGLTQGQSYPTPILDGSVTIMTLDTFQSLPVFDLQLDSHFASDVEMSFNLWMCADGIDIVTSLRAKTTLGLLQHKDKAGMSPASVARLAYTWMGGQADNNDIGAHVLHALEKSGGVTVDHLEKAGKLKDIPDATKGGLMKTSCRSFDWYAKEVNVVMGKELEMARKNALESAHGSADSVLVTSKNVDKPSSHGGHLAPEYEAKIKDHFIKEEKAISQVTGRLPSKPLSEINQQIISTAKMVDLAYVDVTDGQKEDPHRGAKDEEGNFGYVHDEKALRRNPPQFQYTDDQIQCENNDGNKRMLTQKVFVDIPAHEAAERNAETSGKPRAKIFCLVYTIDKFHDRIPAIRETWGQKCDGFMVGSTKTDRDLGTVNIPHAGIEEYDNIWQKVRSMWSYIYDHYYEEYDWFHIGGDDLYLIVENLRLYLESEEIQLAANGGKYLPNGNETKQLPLFLGRRFKEQGNEKRIFNSGGSGYTMNKAALKSLVVDAFPTCMPHLRTFAEDVMVAQCFRNKLGVYPFDTKDENCGERYMPFTPRHHLNYRIPSDVKSDWYANYSIDIKEGLDHCSSQSVAFHYIKGDLMKRMHAILYGYCT
jgi:glycoprotein-N-acetylgalactosamine 3-beta-galactosyltransferase